MTVNQDVRLTFHFLSGFVCSESHFIFILTFHFLSGFPFEQELTDEIFLRKHGWNLQPPGTWLEPPS